MKISLPNHRNGLPHGLGVIFYKNGKFLEGRFAEGKLVNKVFDDTKCQGAKNGSEVTEQTTTTIPETSSNAAQPGKKCYYA